MVESTERDPLLRDAHSRPRIEEPPSRPPSPNLKLQGPLEISRANRHAILAGIWVATFLTALNTTLVATLLSSISSDFEKSNQIGWLGTSYLLATCTFTPLYGRLCNAMGRRRANQTAIIFSAVGVLACGLSRNLPMLVVSRFIAGIGGGGIFTTATIITSDMYSMRSRGLTQGIASIFNGLGQGLGGPVGGIISDRFGWRWAFLMQIPFLVISFTLTSYNLHYVTPGEGKSTKDILKRIDYGGSFSLLMAVLSVLSTLSLRYNNEYEWNHPFVILSLVGAVVFSISFVIVELYIAPEPVLAGYLLKQKVPVLVSTSNFLVAICNFTVMYFFPMFFETVLLTDASTAGLHLLPNSVGMSSGSLFAGYLMHRTGRYKMVNLIFGILPFIGAVMLTQMREDSGPILLWFSNLPLGFGNAVVLQTTLIALLAHLPRSAMAVGTGFSTLFRGIGQVGGVAISSAIFQYYLNKELRTRIRGPDADELIYKIRHSVRAVASLPPDLQRVARESYAVALKTIFTFAACSTLLSYIVRIPIPEKSLDEPDVDEDDDNGEETPSAVDTPFESDLDDEAQERPASLPKRPKERIRTRRLSTYESVESVMDPEDDEDPPRR